MAGYHSTFSPSKIEQLALCPASYVAHLTLPDTSSLDPVTGTAAHEVHERCLKLGTKAKDYLGEVIPVEEPDKTWEVTVDDEMVNAVQESVDRCNELGGLRFVEVRVEISEFTPIPGQSGSSDFFTIDEEKRTLYVVDYKHGKGVRVDAYLNAQLAYYALGVLRGIGSVFHIERIVIIVHQPRLDNWDRWETTPGELIAIGRIYKHLLARCLLPKPPFHPAAKACRFCKARSSCPARAEQLRRVAVGMFDDLDADIEQDELGLEMPGAMPSLDLMSLDNLAAVHRHAASIKGFLQAVENKLLHAMLHSESVEGLKPVEGRSFRVYRDPLAERQAAAYLLQQGVAPAQVFNTEIASPAKAEKFLPKAKRKEFGELFVVKPPGKPTIAPSDDRRPAYTLTADGMFDDLDAPEDGDF